MLFAAVVQQLRNLPSYVDTELTPPTVVLDSKSSSNGEDVLATCGMAPGIEDGPINCITTSTHNGRFRSLGVGPGDVLKYYVLYDEDSAGDRHFADGVDGSDGRPSARRQFASMSKAV